jgi:hypothetical protein
VPQGQQPFASHAPNAGQATGPEGDYDPERTVSISRPKGPFPAAQEQGGRPQRPADEGSFATTRIPKGSPGQQVYPVPAPPPGQPQQQSGPPQMMPQQPQQGPQGQQFGGHGLGTDLFAIAGPPEEKRPAGNRNGMLVLMAVAAAAAVVIAVLIVALFSS